MAVHRLHCTFVTKSILYINKNNYPVTGSFLFVWGFFIGKQKSVPSIVVRGAAGVAKSQYKCYGTSVIFNLRQKMAARSINC